MCSEPPPPSRGKGRETPAILVRRLIREACNNGDLSVLEKALALPVGPGTAGPPAPSRLPRMLAAFQAAVPDARWAIEEQITQEETVVTRLSVTGTFSGPLLGLAPPGRPATLTGVAISRFAAGRLVEVWLQADLLGFLQQLGVMPPLDLDQAVAVAQVARVGALASSDGAESDVTREVHPFRRTRMTFAHRASPLDGSA